MLDNSSSADATSPEVAAEVTTSLYVADGMLVVNVVSSMSDTYVWVIRPAVRVVRYMAGDESTLVALR